MPDNIFPAAEYDDPDVGYTLIALNRALIPLLEGQLEGMLLEEFWSTQLDYERGYNAISEVIASIAMSNLQDLIDSNARIETLLGQINTKVIAAPSTEARQVTELLRLGDLAEVAPATDTASAGMNARLQRVAQNITNVLNSDLRIEAALAAILAKQIAAPSTEAQQVTELLRLGDLAETAPASDTASAGINGRLQRLAQRLTSLLAQLPATLGQKAAAQSLAVVIATDQVVNTRQYRPSTTASSNVAASTANTTLLGASATRTGATIYNDSSAVLYLKLGSSASLTSYTVQINAGGYYEVPYGFMGIIDGIWSSAAGAARITEVS